MTSATRTETEGMVSLPPLSSLRRAIALLLITAAAMGALAGADPAPASAATQTAGVQAHLLWAQYDAADRERMLDRVQQAGVGMVRVDLGWSSLEQDGNGKWNAWYLDKVDHVVTEARERDIKVLFTFWETPCWASTAPADVKQDCRGAWWDRDVQRYPPADAADYGEALAFMVKRYGDQVAAWELWNEPNHPHYFRAQNKVASYAALVKAAYPRAKAADPNATIIAGSLADSDFEFTEALLDQGVGGNFDAWSVHPYSEDRSPLHPGIAGWTKKSFAVGVPEVRKTLLRHGEEKPIWLTEFGWSTCTVRGSKELWANCVDPATQATYLTQAFGQMQEWDYVPVGMTFNLEDTSDVLDERLENYGLLRTDGSPKPAYAALTQSAQALSSGSTIRASARPSRAAKPLTLRIRRAAGRTWVSGRLRVGSQVRVKLHRMKGAAPRMSRRVAYTATIATGARGRFRHRINLAAAGRGQWLAVAKVARRPQLAASAVLR